MALALVRLIAFGIMVAMGIAWAMGSISTYEYGLALLVYCAAAIRASEGDTA